MESQTSLALATKMSVLGTGKKADQYGRVAVSHPQLAGLENLSEVTKGTVLLRGALWQVGERVGLTKVMRWNPEYVSCFESLTYVKVC